METQTKEYVYDKPGGYISEIKFNNGKTVAIKPNDIVLFVGPNNAGKSQALKDIYALCENSQKSATVVKSLQIIKGSKKIKPLLDNIAFGVNHGSSISYSFLNYSMTLTPSFELRQYSEYGDFRSVFVAHLNTDSRLTICRPATSVNRNQVKNNPILYAAFDYSRYGKWLSESFYRAFGEHLVANTQFGSSVPLCIGDEVNLDGQSFANETERQAKYAEILDSYKQVHNQGDGIRSFTGILLYLMMDNFCTYLIDEPESFLHPPQAHTMGQIIGETLKENQQAFISTHSEEIIKGLLDTAPDRIKIIRITRENDNNEISFLDNNDFTRIWKDPLLKYSNIMSGIFHKKVILCESDSDCKFYSIIDDSLHKELGRFSENLYIHCGGKQRMAKIVCALKSLNIDVKLIPDFDVLNDENIFKGITSAFGIDWKLLERDYNIINSNLKPKTIERAAFKTQIINIIDSKKAKLLTDKEIKLLQETIKTHSKWETVKKLGQSGLPSGDASAAFQRLNNLIKAQGINLVPVGELECFIRSVGGHGQDWVNRALEEHPNLSDDVYKEVKLFLKEVI